VLILKDLEKLEDGTAKMGNVQAETSWRPYWRSTEKLHGRARSGGVSAGYLAKVEGKQFEPAK